MKKNIRFERIDKNNFKLASTIQNEIFNGEDGSQNYIEQINKDPSWKEQDYYLVYVGKRPIGITGIYSYHEYPDVAWLGWFGVLKKERNKGYGSLILDKTIELAKEKGYKEFRLYTDEYAKDAHKLYEKRGMIKELYDNKNDQDQYFSAKVYIYSKSLIKKEIDLWNNKKIGLKEQGEKEQINKIKSVE